MSRLKQFLLLGALILAGVEGRAQDGFRVIVNKSNPVDSMSENELSDIFLKRMTRWEDGGRVLPLDQSDSSAVRERFSRQIHGKSVSAIKNYWQQQIFAGRDVPPPEKVSDREVVAYVESNPGAFGYVTADAPVGSVKVIAVEN